MHARPVNGSSHHAGSLFSRSASRSDRNAQAKAPARGHVDCWSIEHHAKERLMATSTLLQTGEQAPVLDKGHGTDALGPSDTSDSGSDLQGGHGLVMDEDLGLDTGTNEDATRAGE